MSRSVLLRLAIAGLATTVPMVVAFAQAAPRVALEEITVTAQKREQQVQDVGIAVAVVTAEQMSDLGITTATDVATFTPGVNVGGSFAGQFLTFSIRGVTQTDVLDHTEAPTAVYMDDGYVAALNGQGMLMFDIERLEVLKGPQGTLFGRNATGGAVNIVSRRPGKETQGFFDLTYGRYDEARLEAAVGGPLSDTAQGRVAGLYSQRNPYHENLYPGGVDPGGYRNWGVRGQLAIQPGDDVDILLTAFAADQTMNTPPYQSRSIRGVTDDSGTLVNAVEAAFPTLIGTTDPDGRGPQVLHDFSREDVNELQLYGGTARVDWRINGMTLTSVTDYKRFEKALYLDADVTEVPLLNTANLAVTTNYSEELRLFGSSGAVRWTLGAYYLHIDSDIPRAAIDIPVFGIVEQDTYRLKTDSLSGFVQVEYDLSQAITLIGGVRVTGEDKKFDYVSNTYVSAGNPIDPPGAFLFENRPPIHEDRSQTLVSAKLELDYHFGDAVLLYASFNRGVKAGSFNAPFGGAPSISDEEVPYDPETLYAYELGLKSTLLGGSTRANAAAFVYDYKDYQAFLLEGLSTQVVNNDARYYGIEGEVNSRLSEHWSLLASAAWIDATVKDVNVFGRIVDRRPTFTPGFAASGVLRYEFDAIGGQVGLQAEVNYKGDSYYSLSNFDSARVRAYTLANVRASYTTGDGRWQFAGFVRNLTDEEYFTVGFDFPDFGFAETAYGDPRTYGITVRYQF